MLKYLCKLLFKKFRSKQIYKKPCLLGIAFSLRNIFAPIIVLIICIVCYGIRIKIEEKALKEQFKEEFENYRKNTYCLFPFIW
ncbi:protein-S-isoprenylcysteine O-methyltransferase Ste14 [Clostridium algifaecis]|uniref:Protein-S-isoprenylcysteine O-methyltransferase Ste14 n=1 Tax=Clostridium algifaecis TaxID=1472040 RepID=A0ABS4KPE6_9CLOT|nr:protein-S-isoprenylcysteine O-methyltransferase Ste14 [Clostridium algifaecis]